MLVLFRIGATNAVNAAAQTKKTSSPTKIQDIPLMRRFFFGATAESATAVLGYWPPAKPSIFPVRRNPQFRQKRSSAGIVEWQFEQTVSVNCDIADPPIPGVYAKNTRPGSIRQILFSGCILAAREALHKKSVTLLFSAPPPRSLRLCGELLLN